MKESECYPGKKVGRLTLLYRTRINTKSYGKRWEWTCKCDCGNIRKVLTFRLDDVIDCGHHTKEKLSRNGKKGRKSLEDLKDSNLRSPYRRLYMKWHDMIGRCTNPKSSNYAYYGGRGIRVCDAWKNYKEFKNWALGQGYNPNDNSRKKQTLDRINVNKGYCPSNCRLVSTKVQNSNKRNNVYVTYKGTTLTLTQWSQKTGINRNTLNARYNKGLREDQLFNEELDMTPRKHKGKLIAFMGKTVSYYELAKKYNLDYNTIKYRYEHRGLRDSELVAPTKNRK